MKTFSEMLLIFEQIKSHKSPKEIAKKHKVSLEFIMKQLDIGISIEHEHTKDEELAKDIALQHLNEIPDYYTRLKKLEASAKKQENKINEGTLHHWFKGSKSKDGKPGWVQADGSPCANEPGEKKTPKCFSSGRLRVLKRKGKKGRNLIKAAIRRKRKEDPRQQKKSGGAKPTNVSKGKRAEVHVTGASVSEAKAHKCPKCGGEMVSEELMNEKKDACYYKVKSRYKVWPSAYASGALVKCRKKGSKNWGNKSK